MKRKESPKERKWLKYTRWYEKIPVNKEIERLKEQCCELGIKNIIW